MTTTTSIANERITDEVTSWPGVEAGTGSRGEFGFRVGGREVGHLHERSAHFAFGRELGLRLRAEERIVDHPVFPGKPGIGARRIESDADVDEVIALMRLNYDRIVERHGLGDGGGVSPTPGTRARAASVQGFARPSLARRR